MDTVITVKLINTCQRKPPVYKNISNTLRPQQNSHNFANNIFKCIFLNKNIWITIKISLNSVCKGEINNIPALVEIMAWRWCGDEPLSEPMMVCLLTHICITRPQWVNLRKLKLKFILGPVKAKIFLSNWYWCPGALAVVATVLSMHACFSTCLWVNSLGQAQYGPQHF